MITKQIREFDYLGGTYKNTKTAYRYIYFHTNEYFYIIQSYKIPNFYDIWKTTTAEDIDSMEYYKIPENESWRVNLLTELIETKENNYEVPGISRDELDDILRYICTT